ncbi:MAG: hypothetical protein SGI73_02690 [Chloroflexota bacterium]|nr:hypothetical protein [Chloroflexota bacterium]
MARGAGGGNAGRPPARRCVPARGSFNTRCTLLQPDFNPAYLLKVGELAGVFADWRALHGAEAPDTVTAQLVALKREM